MIRSLLGAGAACCALSASVNAALIYAGTGSPQASFTTGNPEMPSFQELGFGTTYSTSGVRITLTQTTRITGLRAVCNTDQPLSSVHPILNVFAASGPMSREQAFAASPLLGNAASASMSLTGVPLAFGNSMNGRTNYLLSFEVLGFELPAGSYIFSPMVQVLGGDWNFVETDLSLGTAIVALDSHPGQYFEYSAFGSPYSTGSLAIDVFGDPVPSPGGAVALAGFGLLGLSRRRRPGAHQ